MGRRWIRALLITAGVVAVFALFPRRVTDSSFRPEIKAVAAIRIVHTAQTEYLSEYGRYAATMEELAPDIANLAAVGQQSGYRLTLAGRGTAYTVSAAPMTFVPGQSRTFYSDETMVVRVRDGPEPATAKDPESR